VFDVTGDPYVYIYSNELTRGIDRVLSTRTADDSLLLQMPLHGASFGSKIRFAPDNLVFNVNAASSFWPNAMDVRLQDSEGHPYLLSGGCFEMLIRFEGV
jgi:hypothetical protein